MTVNGIEKEMVLEFLEKHKKSEAFIVKEWNRSAENMAVETDDRMKIFYENRKEDYRKKLVMEQSSIKEFAMLLGKRTKHVDIRTQRKDNMLGELLEVRSVEVI